MLTRDKILEAIRNSSNNAQKQKREYSLFGRILIFIKDYTSPDISIDNIIDVIEKRIPEHMMEEVDEILVGFFEENQSRDLEAHFKDGAIYVSNVLESDFDFIENIVHESAHALETKYDLNIYGDKQIENEFIGKRRRLSSIIKSEGYDISKYDFEDPEYSESFDTFLYKDVGYDKMQNIVMGLLASPYAATSLREYFANGFEEYFLGDRNYLRDISPQLYNKILEIQDDTDTLYY
tara:strand:- start:277 stop:984 length:708 start_codon:yes stop_codon:yes gene_type:complete